MALDYTLIRSARKTISLEVKGDGTVVVRAPQRLPKREIERFLKSHETWLEQAKARVRAREAAHPEPDEAGREALIARAKELLPKRVAYFAALMGVQPTGLRVTGARTRFGSCSAKNSLCFSWRLMQYPAAAIDYVVVHELAHIVHKNHGPAFYALVASVLPDYKARIAMLRS